MHDLHTINSEKKIEGGFGPLVRQCVEQGLEVVQAAFVEHLTEFPNERAKECPILLPPGCVAWVHTVTVDLA